MRWGFLLGIALIAAGVWLHMTGVKKTNSAAAMVNALAVALESADLEAFHKTTNVEDVLDSPLPFASYLPDRNWSCLTLQRKLLRF